MPTAQELLDQLTGQIADSVREKVMEEIAPQIESLKTAIERLSANDPVTEQPETPAVTAQITDTTSGEWNKGVSTQTARFLLKDTPLNRAAFVKGAKVRLGDGSTRTITSATAQYNAMFVAVDGQMLNPEQVGHPNKVAIAEPGEEVEEEPEPAKEPQPSTGKGQIGFNIGMGAGGDSVLPGKENTNFRLPVESEIQRAVGYGVRRFRIGSLWERNIKPGGRSQLYEDHIERIIEVGRLCKKHGATVMWDLFHNYGGYSNTGSSKDRKKVGDPGGPSIELFANDYKAIIERMKADPDCWDATFGFDIMNEWVGVDYPTVFQASQRFLDVCAPLMDDKKAIFEGINYSSTVHWVKNNPDFYKLKDPRGSLAEFAEFSGHLYLDHAASGFYKQGDSVSAADAKAGITPENIGVKRIQGFANWLKQHGMKGNIGENIVSGNLPNLLKGEAALLDFCIANDIDVYIFGMGDWFGSNPHNVEIPENKPMLVLILDRVS